MTVSHPFGPIFDSESRVLILGSFPSVKSREDGFYYAHLANRFWPVLSSILSHELPVSVPEKIKMLHECRVALFDSAKRCEIENSSDSSIKDVVPNDISPILKEANIKTIFTNGTVAHNLYMKLIYPTTNIEAYKLPSTSAANASMSLGRLKEEWRKAFLAAGVDL